MRELRDVDSDSGVHRSFSMQRRCPVKEQSIASRWGSLSVWKLSDKSDQLPHEKADAKLSSI